MASITLENVSKDYGSGVVGVRDMNLTIEDGEFMIFLGPSGCGKSTTLRMIAGLEDISTGRLRIGERDVTRAAPRERNVAVVFQSYALYPHMSVRQNMEFGLKMRGMAPADRAARIEAAADILGLQPYLNRRPAALSGGQRQRVALGRAMVREPDVFLMDEPLSNLDAKLRAEMRLELIKLHRRLGRTTVFVTHDQVEAMTMGDRICIMRDGNLVQVGKPLEVYANPVDTFVAQFLASPQMNLVEARLNGNAGAIELTSDILSFTLPRFLHAAFAKALGRAVIFGLRPEDIHAEPRPGAVPFEASVVAIEALGMENIAILALDQSGKRELSARLGRDFSASIGDRLTFYADVARMHLFDAETTRAFPRGRME
ncbi:ABC transporter ATP-binding protein [Nitratireductor pacificus]|uniref:ABC transporter n=1 Tax=Nitratireductor pacificus pht-3B TaxID=391937 RepID=K2N960_9HYPH|nr:ABC transporter ATP-binding protein [Nitratireductor pacificus]EKF20628.1 ABC transporter [Nitratireductor pacificus pht-3B]